jgi:hypothetical protein
MLNQRTALAKLGLSPGANEEAIRKAYRRLARKYHPDINPAPNAQELFIEIQEAYDYLTRIKNQGPSTGETAEPGVDLKTRMRQAQRRKEATERQRKMRKQAFYHVLKQSRTWSYYRYLSFIGLGIAFILLLDQVLPGHIVTDQLKAYSMHVYNDTSMGNPISYIETQTGKSIWISQLDRILTSQYQDILIESSWLLHDPLNIYSIQRFHLVKYPVHYTFSASPIICAVLFSIPFILRRTWKDTDVYLLFYRASFVLIGFLALYFLLIRFHIFHLLSLGFF